MRNAAISVAFVVGLTGCGFESSTPPLPPAPFEPTTPAPSRSPEPRHQPSDRTELLAQLEAAQAQWIAEGPMTYELTVSRTCFCDPGVPFVSRVTGVTVVQSTGGHRRDGRNWGPSLRTVELLFFEARRAAHSDADEVKVEFDPRFRYPKRIMIDEWRDGVDDEVEWIAELRVLR